MARGIGIDVAGLRLTGPQYADDTEPLLPFLDQVPALLDAVTTFGAASGQHLNPEKTRCHAHPGRPSDCMAGG